MSYLASIQKTVPDFTTDQKIDFRIQIPQETKHLSKNDMYEEREAAKSVVDVLYVVLRNGQSRLHGQMLWTD